MAHEVWYSLYYSNSDPPIINKVRIDGDLTDLQQAVYDKNINKLKSFDASDLVVYPVGTDITTINASAPTIELDTPTSTLVTTARQPVTIVARPPPQPPQQPLVSTSMPTPPAYVTESWKHPFADPTHQAEELFQLCVNYQQQFRHSFNYYSPYTFVHQSSGMGKSRLLQQVLEYAASKNVTCFYFCVRAKTGDQQGAWPPRSPIADRLQQYSTTQEWTYFFTSFLLTYYDSTHQSAAENWWRPEMDQNWQNDLPIEQMRKADVLSAERIIDNLSKQRKAQPNFLRFLVAFDEVGSLQNPSGFQSLIRSMIGVNNAFFLCADTTSLLPQFAPDMSHPSFRVSVQGKALFHPYYLLDTVDQLRERQLEKWPACMSLRGMSKFGRTNVGCNDER